MATTAPRTMTSGDHRSSGRSSPGAWPAFIAASTEIAIALVVFAAAMFAPVPGSIPATVLRACLAILGGLQLGVGFALRQRDERLRRFGMWGAGALALIGLLVTATLFVAIGLLLAVSLIDLAFGLPPSSLDEPLAELGLAEYVSARGMAIAIPVVGWLTLLNARSALRALGETARIPSSSSS